MREFIFAIGKPISYTKTSTERMSGCCMQDVLGCDRRRLFTIICSSDASIKLPHIRLRDVARFCHANSARFDELQCLV